MTETQTAGTTHPQTEHAPVLPSLILLEALENSRAGFILFDSRQRVLHITAHTFLQLGIAAPNMLAEPELLNLFRSSALDAPSCEQVTESISAYLGGLGQADPIPLRKRDGTVCARFSLHPLSSGYCAISLEDVPAADVSISAVPEPSALRDSLTGLANRPHFEEALLRVVTRTPATPAALLLIDLDRFKVVNDTLGHGTGDALLRLVAERLQSAVRKGDTVARFGGDEFAILLDPAPRRDEPAAISRRILDIVQRTYLIEGQIVNIGTSIGIALFPEDGADGKALLRNSDLALYQSKAGGRGMFRFFDLTMEERARARRTDELELRKALAMRQLELYYQPQVDTAAGHLAGFEALLRWRHPVRGIVSPGDFLPLAEELGLMVPIGEWVLRTACREAMKWPGNLVVAVNASPIQFDAGTFAESVAAVLRATGLPGERLEIEVTEGILLRNTDVVQATLHRLRAMKVRIAMDDFGVGYASLSQLAKFPFDKIKIDRSLAGTGGDDIKQRAIVRAITALGQSLGVCTLAEGVEDASQLARLQSDGCASVQGYFCGRPVPASELTATISRLATNPNNGEPE